jgi:diaminopimelate decarboxylase
LKISTGHEKSKFGIPIDQLDFIKEIVAEHGIKLKALHIHTGSDIKDAEVFVHGVKVLSELVGHFP